MTTEGGTMADQAKDHENKSTRTVRTTMRPQEELEVTETQYQELRTEGLLIEKGNG
jgi:hypothetical protein